MQLLHPLWDALYLFVHFLTCGKVQQSPKLYDTLVSHLLCCCSLPTSVFCLAMCFSTFGGAQQSLFIARISLFLICFMLSIINAIASKGYKVPLCSPINFM
jgi:hypothetical protein